MEGIGIDKPLGRIPMPRLNPVRPFRLIGREDLGWASRHLIEEAPTQDRHRFIVTRRVENGCLAAGNALDLTDELGELLVLRGEGIGRGPIAA